MDSRYRKFLALVDTGSFSAAARKLHVTQPAISLAVASLEHELHARLYVRRARPIVLTAEGQAVARAARAIAAEHERLLAALRMDKPPRRVRIGLIDSIAHLLYSSEEERQVLSGAEVSVDNSRRILRGVREGRIDAGIVTGQPALPRPGMVVRKLQGEEFIFVCAPELAARRAHGRVDDWLATNPDSTTYEYFLRLFAREHLQVTPIFHSASMELLRDMAIAGKGTALLPRHIVEAPLQQGSLAIVGGAGPFYRPIWAVARKHSDLSVLGPLLPWLGSTLRPMADA